jgi:glycosyltransferase involved in cell wall biosynthesis
MKVCQAISQQGHEVKLWVPGTSPVDFVSIRDQYGLQSEFEIAWLPARNTFKRYDFAWQAVEHARVWQADVIYTWTPQAALFSVWRGEKTILEMHDRATGNLGPLVLKQFLQANSAQTELVCVTRALHQALETQLDLDIPDQKVVIAPNGVDTERYQNLPEPAAAREQLGLKQVTTVSYTGHFYAGRGVDILFELARAFPLVQFLWIGGRESELTQVREQLAESALANVVLTGFINNQRLPLYQAASDVLLMPYERSIAGSSGGNSADICSPMKMFEYMAAGRLILTSDLPVIHEVLDEATAVFCPPEDSAAWIHALDEALENPGMLQAKGQAARALMNRYTIQARQENILRAFTA